MLANLNPPYILHSMPRIEDGMETTDFKSLSHLIHSCPDLESLEVGVSMTHWAASRLYEGARPLVPWSHWLPCMSIYDHMLRAATLLERMGLYSVSGPCICSDGLRLP